MSENKTRVLSGQPFFLRLRRIGAVTDVNSLRYSCCTFRSAGDLPLKTSRVNRSSRVKSEWFPPIGLDSNTTQHSTLLTATSTSSRISSTVPAPLSRHSIVLRNPKYRMAPSDSTITLDRVSSTDNAQSEVRDFWRWFAWQGLWVGKALVFSSSFYSHLYSSCSLVSR